MGLDNGLMIKAKTLDASRYLEANFEDLRDRFCSDGPAYEFWYGRKDWNVRAKFLSVFHDKEYDGSGGDIYLTIADLVQVREIFKYFLDEKHWYEDRDRAFGSGSIWTWEQSLRSTAEAIYNITRFLEDVYDEEFTDEDFEIWFYDSY